jgi:hypothetical protein
MCSATTRFCAPDNAADCSDMMPSIEARIASGAIIARNILCGAL